MTTSNPFWEYSLALYQRPGVANFCLTLQDDISGSADVHEEAKPLSNTNANDDEGRPENANVNILLFCCWVGSQGVALSDTDIETMKAAIAPWHKAEVLPLRAARRAPDITTQQKQALLELELKAEQTEQELLFSWFQSLSKKPKPLETAFKDSPEGVLEERPARTPEKMHSRAQESMGHNLSRYLLSTKVFIDQGLQISQVLFEGNPLQRQAEQCMTSELK